MKMNKKVMSISMALIMVALTLTAIVGVMSSDDSSATGESTWNEGGTVLTLGTDVIKDPAPMTQLASCKAYYITKDIAGANYLIAPSNAESDPEARVLLNPALLFVEKGVTVTVKITEDNRTAKGGDVYGNECFSVFAVTASQDGSTLTVIGTGVSANSFKDSTSGYLTIPADAIATPGQSSNPKYCDNYLKTGDEKSPFIFGRAGSYSWTVSATDSGIIYENGVRETNYDDPTLRYTRIGQKDSSLAALSVSNNLVLKGNYDYPVVKCDNKAVRAYLDGFTGTIKSDGDVNPFSSATFSNASGIVEITSTKIMSYTLTSGTASDLTGDVRVKAVESNASTWSVVDGKNVLTLGSDITVNPLSKSQLGMKAYYISQDYVAGDYLIAPSNAESDPAERLLENPAVIFLEKGKKVTVNLTEANRTAVRGPTEAFGNEMFVIICVEADSTTNPTKLTLVEGASVDNYSIDGKLAITTNVTGDETRHNEMLGVGNTSGDWFAMTRAGSYSWTVTNNDGVLAYLKNIGEKNYNAADEFTEIQGEDVVLKGTYAFPVVKATGVETFVHLDGFTGTIKSDLTPTSTITFANATGIVRLSAETMIDVRLTSGNYSGVSGDVIILESDATIVYSSATLKVAATTVEKVKFGADITTGEVINSTATQIDLNGFTLTLGANMSTAGTIKNGSVDVQEFALTTGENGSVIIDDEGFFEIEDNKIVGVGGAIVLADGATMTYTNNATTGTQWSLSGNATLSSALTLAANQKLTVPLKSTLTVSGGVLTLNTGTLDAKGDVIVSGNGGLTKGTDKIIGTGGIFVPATGGSVTLNSSGNAFTATISGNVNVSNNIDLGAVISILTIEGTLTIDNGKSITAAKNEIYVESTGAIVVPKNGTGKIEFAAGDAGDVIISADVGAKLSLTLYGGATSVVTVTDIVAGVGGLKIIRGSVYIDGVLRTPDENGKIVVQAGDVKIAGTVDEGITLEIPLGMSVIVPAGKTLEVAGGAEVVANGTINVEAAGSAVIYDKGAVVNGEEIQKKQKQTDSGIEFEVIITLVSENPKKLILGVDSVAGFAGATYGELLSQVPVITSSKSVTFAGWYLESMDEKITSGTTILSYDHTVTAHCDIAEKVPVTVNKDNSDVVESGPNYALIGAFGVLLLSILALAVVIVKKK